MKPSPTPTNDDIIFPTIREREEDLSECLWREFPVIFQREWKYEEA